MSVYATWWHADAGLHDDTCAKWRPLDPGEDWARLDVPTMHRTDGTVHSLDPDAACTCRCGPLAYQGSHIIPSPGDRRAGSVDVAGIPAFVPYQRVGVEDSGVGDGVLPWLRLSVHAATVVLDREQVAGLAAALDQWLDRVVDVDA